MKLSVNDVSGENMLIRKGQDSQKDIMAHTRAWIKGHRKTFDKWIEEAKKTAR